MTDPLRDPRFPSRPQTADYWRMSEVLLQHDGKATEGGQRLPEIAEGLVDSGSAAYVALNRAGHAARELGVPDELVPKLAAIWMDAFIAGIAFEKRGGHREEG